MQSLTSRLIVIALAVSSSNLAAQSYGPFNATFPAAGDGIEQVLGEQDALIRAPEWTLAAWIEPEARQSGQVLVAGFGPPMQDSYRFLALLNGRPQLVTQSGTLTAPAPLSPGWHHVAATLTAGKAALYLDGQLMGVQAMTAAPVAPIAELAPRIAGQPAFAGRLASFALELAALSPAALADRAKRRPDPDLIVFQTGSPTWPVQVRQIVGLARPQDAWTLPTAITPPSSPAAAAPSAQPAIEPLRDNRWAIHNWRLAAAPGVREAGSILSGAQYDASRWYPATVPGTVLKTLVDRGVYPDPAYGLNNMAIPESLAHQDYWYRSEFDAPVGIADKQQSLLFNGINYAAEVWLNGERLGTMKGAFIRGSFDVTGKMRFGRNALAVRVSPPPHPGIAHEESLVAGPGYNGGMMMLDGPTFVATEGWDWMPAIRDRNTGLWQGVEFRTTGPVSIGDAQIVTTLPKPDNSVADVEIIVPVTNVSERSATATVRAAFDDVMVDKKIALAAGQSAKVVLRSGEFAQLAVRNPRLWWPNGYGDPALHDLTLTTSMSGQTSDTKHVRFGMRQVTYGISLMDTNGHLQRVNIDPSKARQLGRRIVDGSHAGIRKIAGGWVASLAAGAQDSPAVTAVKDEDGLSPYLVLRVNGVRIAARGGNIGMDDFMKRVDRAHLEPYFRLHREAHLNVIRNWVGQNSEENFYELADEYGLMVLNDFWESTQDDNLEAEDPALFMANATDVVRRFRNHPSIVLWFGRNEGVPQPVLNERLEKLIARDDGTRLYMGSSNRINLQNSGPYDWRPPVEYFTEHGKGFAVELGTPSLPTLEAWKRAIPPGERWPISDSWAYHDWHHGGNGDVKGYMDALAEQYGEGTSLEDFERKAQMMQYVSYRAIFEGFNAGLWKTNSARMLWMTQPAWPSSAWQIFSHDYDTQASFYAVKKASEPIHVQMNLPDHKIVLVNNRTKPLGRVQVRARVMSLDNRVLADRSATISAPAAAVSEAFTLDLAPLMADGVALVRLEASDADGKRLSDNFYWESATMPAMRAIDALAPVALTTSSMSTSDGAEIVTSVTLKNTMQVPAIEAKLTMMNADGSQILPAYFSDNYVSLLPGEERTLDIRYPVAAVHGATTITLRGWNVKATTLAAR